MTNYEPRCGEVANDEAAELGNGEMLRRSNGEAAMLRKLIDAQ